MQGSTAAGLRAAGNHSLGTGGTPPAPELSACPALETAIAAEETELLEIGVGSYRQYLANGVKERTDRAVAVLTATEALVREPWSRQLRRGLEYRRGFCRCFPT